MRTARATLRPLPALFPVLWPALALLVVAACAPGPDGDPGSDARQPAETAEIAWFQGSVEEAFASALRQDKPLFLYWGAKWCPPCHYLKDKIFKRSEFVAKSREFVPVYLDGDTQRAQLLAERFGARGYPTVIIFDPRGEEVLRMTSGIPVERYTGVLDTALAKMRPLGEVLAEVLAEGPAQAEPAELDLLAFHSWDQDAKIDLSDEEKLETFATLYEHTPPELAVERSRFLCLYLEQAIRRREASEEAAEETETPVLAAETRVQIHSSLIALLQDRELRNANLFFVFHAAAPTIDLLHPEPSAQRDALVDQWDAAARACEDDETLSLDDRLTALSPRLELARLRAGAPAAGEASAEADLESVALPEELVNHLRERITWANDAVHDEGELQAVMSTMASLLAQAELVEEAENLLVERMDQTAAPHYFMSLLGNLKAESDQPEEALIWFRKAYEHSKGPHTRFQWGSSYLRNAMELAPEEAETIESVSLEVLSELFTQEDALANRNHRGLQRLASALESWNEGGEHREVLDRIRDFVHSACDRFADVGEDSQRARCLSFLAG